MRAGQGGERPDPGRQTKLSAAADTERAARSGAERRRSPGATRRSEVRRRTPPASSNCNKKPSSIVIGRDDWVELIIESRPLARATAPLDRATPEWLSLAA